MSVVFASRGSIVNRFAALPRAVVALAGLAAMAAVWFLDRLTGAEISFSIFYLGPITYLVWLLGRAWVLPSAALGAALWLGADLTGGREYSHPGTPYWNALVRLGFFSIVGSLLWRVRGSYRVHAEASRLKSSMLSIVTHEFGNALNALAMATAMLKESEPSESSVARQHCYGVLDRTIVHLTSATANFLNLGRMETGRFELAVRPTAVRKVVEDVLELLKPLADQKHVGLILDYPAEIIPVHADPDALALILSNLVGNGIKYTPAGGEVRVRVAVGAPQSVQVSVQDTGIGIPVPDRERIFSGGFRSAEAANYAKGYGVGLRVTRELVESHGSRLEVESQPGKGSCFAFSLRMAA
ncbi:MAG: HAMP domain-containing histidine kinase [Elusimicrobia bacterium]|nr:HAMP domain-containing histidine kinase [Elusimicrobiota bacterium]